MEERIKAIYNDCWKIYKQYLSTHDMKLWNQNVEELIHKYDAGSDIQGLLFWFCGRVQMLHDAHENEVKKR